MSINLLRINELINATYHRDEYPVLARQIAEWGATKPLRGLVVMDAAPVFRNTLIKHLALLAAGAELHVGLSPLISHDAGVVELLRRAGIPIVWPDARQGEVDLVLDCAGAYAGWKARVGYVELTRSGLERYAHCECPVFMADSGRVKQIETCLGTGESYYRAMAHLGYTDWKDKKLVVFGSGKVGTGLVTYAHRMGARVWVVTDVTRVPSVVRQLAAGVVDYRQTAHVDRLLPDAYAVVTATGVKDALEGNVTPEVLIESAALLANMGVEDEFGPSIPAGRVLENKRTLNFILEEPTHLKYIEATMALHNQGALHLLQHPRATGIINPPEEMEQHMLCLTLEQGCIGEELREFIERQDAASADNE